MKAPFNYDSPRKAAILGFMILIAPFAAGDVAEEAMRAVLLESSPANLQMHDVNKDSMVNVADLMMLARFIPEVEFKERTTLVREGGGPINLELKVGGSFAGNVNYSVRGSAVAPSDYEVASGTVWVSNTNPTLSIVLKDDTEIEGSETLIVALSAPAPGNLSFALGGVSQHTVTIEDNDAIWEGTLDDGYLQIPFELSLIHSGAGNQAVFTSDGKGAFPVGSWPTTVATLSQTRFEATVGPVATQAGQTLFQAAFSRSIRLVCEPGPANPQDVFLQGQVINGSMLQEFQFEGATNQHLNRLGANGLAGRFTLRRKTPTVRRDAPALVTAP